MTPGEHEIQLMALLWLMIRANACLFFRSNLGNLHLQHPLRPRCRLKKRKRTKIS